MAEAVKQYLHNDRALLGNGSRAALATSLFVLTGFAAGLSILFLLDKQNTQNFYGKLALTLLLSSCSFGAMKWRASFLEYTDARPDPESWRLAEAVIMQHSIPFWPLVIALSVACTILITGSVVAAFIFLNMNSYVELLLWLAATIAGCALIFRGGMKFARRLVSIYYPNQPYVWGCPRGINVSGKVFIDWSNVEQIDTRWELHKSRYHPTGAVIWSNVARENGKTIVPLMNATIDVSEAVTMMRQMAHDNGLMLPDQAAPNARPAKPLTERDWRRAYRKSPELRQMLLGRLESLGKSILQAEQELEGLSTKIAKYENKIAENHDRISMSSAKLREIKRNGALTLEFEVAIQNASKSFNNSISYYEKQILEIPSIRQDLQERLSNLLAELADNEEKKLRYLG